MIIESIILGIIFTILFKINVLLLIPFTIVLIYLFIKGKIKDRLLSLIIICLTYILLNGIYAYFVGYTVKSCQLFYDYCEYDSYMGIEAFKKSNNVSFLILFSLVSFYAFAKIFDIIRVILLKMINNKIIINIIGIFILIFLYLIIYFLVFLISL